MSRKSLIAGAVVLMAWLCTMGVLLRNHYLMPEQVPQFDNQDFFGGVRAVERWKDIEEYMLILQNGRKIGASLTEIRQVKDTSGTLTHKADFRLEIQISPVLPKLSVNGVSQLNRRLELNTFHAEAAIGPAKFSSTGKAANDLLYVSVHKPNNVSLKTYKLSHPISLAEAVRPALRSQMEIEPGNQLKTPVVDPLSGQNRGTLTIMVGDKESITVGGRRLEAYRVTSTLHDIETVMWVDDNGNTLRRQLVGNYTMERATREEVLAQAPSLAEGTEIPELDISEFSNVPVERGSGNSESNSSLELLRSFL